MEGYSVEKWLWTQDDYEEMGWHDSTIHAIAFLHSSHELALDIDYIFEWIPPRATYTHYKFWVAPATLIFENVNNVTIDLELFDEVQLQGIIRGESRKPRNADHIANFKEWNWKVDSNVGEIDLWSVGYKQFIRLRPRLIKHQTLSLDDRGGLSFFRGKMNR